MGTERLWLQDGLVSRSWAAHEIRKYAKGDHSLECRVHAEKFSYVRPGRMWADYPEGSKDSNNGALGPKFHTINGTWALKPYHLGPWTLRV